MDQICKFGEQTSRILEFKPEGLDFQYKIKALDREIEPNGILTYKTHLSLPNACKLMFFDRNINGNRDVKFLIGIIGHCTDERNLIYL